METPSNLATTAPSSKYLGTAIILLSLFGCGEASVPLGVDMEIRIDAPFSNSTSVVATITPADTPSFADVAGAVECVRLDLENSFAAVNSVQGGDGGAFTLTATIVESSGDTRMLSWQGTLETSQNQTLFTSDNITVDDAANEALTRAYKNGAPWNLRLDLATDVLPDLLSVRLAPRLIVNTAEGGCN